MKDTDMQDFYAIAVFFVEDAERALSHYTKSLGFSLDWNHKEDGRAFVFQVSLLGFELILNKEPYRSRACIHRAR